MTCPLFICISWALGDSGFKLKRIKWKVASGNGYCHDQYHKLLASLREGISEDAIVLRKMFLSTAWTQAGLFLRFLNCLWDECIFVYVVSFVCVLCTYQLLTNYQEQRKQICISSWQSRRRGTHLGGSNPQWTVISSHTSQCRLWEISCWNLWGPMDEASGERTLIKGQPLGWREWSFHKEKWKWTLYS